MARRFFIETFGCQMNEHDSEKIAGLLAHQGMIPAGSPVEADVYILNTCSVREKAAQKVYSRLGEVKAHKGANQDYIIGVVGCVAQQEGEQIVQKAPFVDMVVGTHMYHAIPDLIEDVRRRKKTEVSAHRVEVNFLDGGAPVEIEPILRQNDFRADVTIMEGCNKRCSFCIVPHTRGRERNRDASAVLEEVRKAVDQGYVEILLLGQTVNSYRDPRDPRRRFGKLLAEVASVPGVRRVRFTSPHPRAFDDETIAVIAEFEAVCNQVHLPVQSGSTRVLRRMRRQYSREWFLELVDRFRNCGRPVSLSPDMIVGFPGESEDDFNETMSLVEEVQFESMFSFKYSPRPYTESCAWRDDVPDIEKGRRLMALQALQRKLQLRLHQERYLGQTFEVLVEGKARDGVRCSGRTTTNKVVNFEGRNQPGDFVQVRVIHAGPNSLLGERVISPN